MMKLELLKEFFATVDDSWQSPIADPIARRWLDETATVRCLRASANFVFRADCRGGAARRVCGIADRYRDAFREHPLARDLG